MLGRLHGRRNQPVGELRAVLCGGLPASLRRLVLVRGAPSNPAELEIELDGGRFSHVSVGTGDDMFCLQDLAVLARVLLGCPAMGPMLPRLSIRFLEVTAHDTVVRAEYVKIADGASEDAVQLFVELLPLIGLARVDIEFYSDARESLGTLTLNIQGPARQSAGGRGPSTSSRPEGARTLAHSGQESGSGQCSPLPSPMDLFGAALDCMVADRGPSSSSQQAADGSVEGAAVVGAPGRGDEMEWDVLLLQGPFIAALLSSSEEEDLAHWLRSLGDEAAAAAPGNDWGGKAVLAYQAVLRAECVLVECSSRGAAAAVAAAARLAEGAAAAAGRLEVAFVNTETKGMIRRLGYTEALCAALKSVMTSLWEGSAHGGGGCTQHERLQCLLALHQHAFWLPAKRLLHEAAPALPDTSDMSA
ncbi:hypothetical protein TSOC_001145 [Tetrabaena socialis]|uniref:Uncharacterized protein n=1 Tax=Tetrabaena socialis TaxID=47790 RepID=A0A2J8AHH4_9CHLO|nr:hypothetical protein TSOC_001145 [Tetrabaena socialis]|eukprot:PNH11961.1 hypothetical protein TSOC_001145 [Tetrabaena socialis]